MELYIEAGNRIRLLREAKKLSREQLAELVEISPKFLYEIETGKKGFSAYTLYKIADILGVSADYVLTGKNDSKDIGELEYLIGRFTPVKRNRIEKLLEVVYEICEKM